MKRIDYTIKLKAGGLSTPAQDRVLLSSPCNYQIKRKKLSRYEYWQNECMTAEVKRHIACEYDNFKIREVDNKIKWMVKTRNRINEKLNKIRLHSLPKWEYEFITRELD